MNEPSGSAYFFRDHETALEAQRLQLVERVGDRYSQDRLRACGLRSGAHCLEAGLGAGSMARWMAEEAGPGGRVIGVDLDDRFFPLTEGSGVELVKSDIRSVDIDDSSLDFIHARLLLMHFPDRADVLDRMISWLKPGGWIVIAEADFSFGFRTTGLLGELWQEAHRRFVETIAAVGADGTVGGKFNRLFLGAGLCNVEAECVMPWVVPGGSTGEWLRSNFETVRRLCDLSDMSDEDLTKLSDSLPTGDFVQTGYATVITSGQRPT